MPFENADRRSFVRFAEEFSKLFTLSWFSSMYPDTRANTSLNYH
jgi:hypothetical protein